MICIHSFINTISFWNPIIAEKKGIPFLDEKDLSVDQKPANC